VSAALTALDLFAGAGGASEGLRRAGFDVPFAVEWDASATKTLKANHPATTVLCKDVRRVAAPSLARRLRAPLDLLTACPPCQPFSTLGSGDPDDPRNRLISCVERFAASLRPRALLLENVPGLGREPRFARLLRRLEASYVLRSYFVDAADFGVPQRRRRMIVIGVRRDLDTVPPRDLLEAVPPDFDLSPRTAGQALAHAARLTLDVDPVHRARTPQPKTLERIRAVSQGGGRAQLPKHLELDCHARLGARHATSIYGRIDPQSVAPTMTTRCTTPSCGRFVHPTEDRGLTLREAALLQTFPLHYEFHGTYGSVEAQIGNAVPPRLAEALGLVVAGLIAPATGRSSKAA
jgi:DNA-cytosine methyltransferase